ncbi:hypothetical protein WN51_11727 [Melipona quadrifasciata]|uniref:Uncharacterized protein n=1 Tax=Melipona quadrifasciata TaxID=166423 RepID=A0A0M9A4N8_9HYME|nr:hypothetical protein WN51_11727 [Melipona quadrifasciata]
MKIVSRSRARDQTTSHRHLPGSLRGSLSYSHSHRHNHLHRHDPPLPTVYCTPPPPPTSSFATVQRGCALHSRKGEKSSSYEKLVISNFQIVDSRIQRLPRMRKLERKRELAICVPTYSCLLEYNFCCNNIVLGRTALDLSNVDPINYGFSDERKKIFSTTITNKSLGTDSFYSLNTAIITHTHFDFIWLQSKSGHTSNESISGGVVELHEEQGGSIERGSNTGEARSTSGHLLFTERGQRYIIIDINKILISIYVNIIGTENLNGDPCYINCRGY